MFLWSMTVRTSERIMRKYICCLMAAILLCVVVGIVAVAENSDCPQEHKYLTGRRDTYSSSDYGHYKYTNDIWYCPQCDMEELVVVKSTYEGHTWTYDGQWHPDGDKFHHVKYICWLCRIMKTVDFVCTGPPCAVEYYKVKIKPESY